ncbi:MAG: hypothetical protein WC843_03850 [Candidatus Gracilibacteria bacterium]|jgi:hypothetical protein
MALEVERRTEKQPRTPGVRMGGEILPEDNVVIFKHLLRTRLDAQHELHFDTCYPFSREQLVEDLGIKPEDRAHFDVAFDELLAEKYIIPKNKKAKNEQGRGKFVYDEKGCQLFTINKRKKPYFGPWAPASK